MRGGHPVTTFAPAKAVLQLVVPQPWAERVNQLALERGMNRSRLIREAVEQVYFAEAGSSVGKRALSSHGTRGASDTREEETPE